MTRLFIVIGLLFTISTKAQEVEITPVIFKGEHMPTQIIGMTQDNTGYIWICDLQNGMFRYDGINLLRYSVEPGNVNSITTNRTECITTDGENIWLGTFANGLNKYDPKTNTYTHYLHNPRDSSSIRSDHIRTLAFDQEGMLWIGTLSGVDKLDPKTETFTHIHTQDPDEKILSTEHIRAMHVDREGILWIGSSSPFANETTVGGLFRFDIEQKNIKHYKADGGMNSLSNGMVRAIFEDSQGVLWIGTAGDGLHTLDRQTEIISHHPYLPNHPHKLSRPPLNPDLPTLDHITFIHEDNEGFIWIGTFAGGLCRYDPGKQITYYYHTENLPPYRVESNAYWTSLKTRDNLLWISNWTPNNLGEFIFKINARPTKIPEMQIEGTTRISSFAEDKSGNLFLGTVNGVWKEDVAGKMDHILNLDGLVTGESPGVRQIEFDNHDNLWLPTLNGLYKFNPVSQQLILFQEGSNSPFSISGTNVRTVEYLGDDLLLVGTQQGGLDLLNTKTFVRESIEYNGKDSTLITLNTNEILLDAYEQVWVALGYNGLKRLDWETRQFHDYDLKLAWIYAIFEDSKQNIWVCTESFGLFLYDRDRDTFIQIEDDRGLLTSGSTIFSITEDQQKQLWLMIFGGFIKLNPETYETQPYGMTWGVSSYNISQSFTTSRGEILVGKDNGCYRFYPQELPILELEPSKPFITRINVDNQELHTTADELINSDQKLILQHDHNNISFDINHIDYIIDPEDSKLQYRLFDYEPKWREATSGDEISYYNLVPGEYNLRLRASDINSKWRESSIQFQILNPWWRQWWAYLGYLGLFITGVWQVLRFQRDRTIRLERERAKDRELAQAREIEKAYNQLQATQTQLIHSEKMASLGELTAGIAHEIQNPLNFVNNFSELNSELLAELKEELEKGNLDEIHSIAQDLSTNEEKIVHHGKRAEGIVKSMLQHSRTSTGKKELTDINELIDEYQRLAYHGFLAKDKSFNASFETDVDPHVPKIMIVPQDIGRVLLNLVNNAFHAVDEKAKASDELAYKPTIKVKTELAPLEGGLGGEKRITITISDNGPGIPTEIKDKIFQPFFTTKPTGEGTGLGLSLSYDIIKAHGGELQVETKEGEGSEFMIRLPIV